MPKRLALLIALVAITLAALPGVVTRFESRPPPEPYVPDRGITSWPPTEEEVREVAGGIGLPMFFADATIVDEVWFDSSGSFADEWGLTLDIASDDIVAVSSVEIWYRCPVCRERGPPKPFDSHLIAVLYERPDGEVHVRAADLRDGQTPGPTPFDVASLEWEGPMRVGDTSGDPDWRMP